MTEIEILAQGAIKNIERKNTKDANILLVNLYRTVQDTPSCLQTINDYALVGKSFTLMLCNQLSDDIDTLQTISSIAYLCLSKSIEQQPNNLNLYKDRLLVMNIGHNAFKYTIMSILSQGMDGFSSLMFQSRADIQSRDAIWQMEFSDIEKHTSICSSFPFFEDRRKFIIDKIQRHFFLPAKTKTEVIAQGKELHEKTYKYLTERILIEEDIDF